MGRHIQDGTGVVISVADDKDARYASGWKPYDGVVQEKTGEPDKSWKVDELRKFAADNDIDLAEATKKEDVLAVIAAARQS